MSFAYIYIYTISHVLTFSRSHRNAHIFFLNYFVVTIMLSLSRSLCSLRFSLLKTKNIYHYALIFFSFHIFFFSVSTTFFSLSYFFSSHYALIFFFNLAYFFSQSQLHYSTTFFFIML